MLFIQAIFLTSLSTRIFEGENLFIILKYHENSIKIRCKITPKTFEYIAKYIISIDSLNLSITKNSVQY